MLFVNELLLGVDIFLINIYLLLGFIVFSFELFNLTKKRGTLTRCILSFYR